MKILAFLLLGLFLSTHAAKAQPSVQESIQVIPRPLGITQGEGLFEFTEETVFSVEDKEQVKVLMSFIDLFKQSAGFTPRLKVGSRRGDVTFKIDETLKGEAYKLDVSEKKIRIKASDLKGFFYALQTLRQLLPTSIESKGKVEKVKWQVPAVSIVDEPRMPYRGLMVDVARCFLPKEEMLRIIDCMGMLKMNVLHLHLVGDNGWRIQIDKYPLLTQIGSKRVERPGLSFPNRRNQRQGEPTVETGFYTKQDIRDIVEYASLRQIEIIPEIEMPAHSNAALAAYPLLTCPVVDKFIGVLPGLGGKNADILYCAGNEKVYEFLQDVIDEIVELFPSKYIHLGGDLVNKTHWQLCPLCQKKMKVEGLKDVDELQDYFMSRIGRYVQDEGRRVMAWEEVINSKLAYNSIIFGWKNLGEGGLEAARRGHPFIMTPVKKMYLSRYQGPQWFEPETYFGNNTLKDMYDYDPVEISWSPQMRNLFMGIQACMWTEFCDKKENVEYMIFPRITAVAETAWSSPMYKDWNEYLKALDNYTKRLELMGINYAKSMFNIQHKVTVQDNKLQVELDCVRPDVEIRYTTDGSAPTAESDIYRWPWSIKREQTVKCATFKDGKQMGNTLVLPIKWNKATAKRLLHTKSADKCLLNGVRGSKKYTDFEWTTWYKKDSITFVLDLGKREKINKITLGFINNFGMAVHLPKEVKVLLSNNEVIYWPVIKKELNTQEVFREGIFTEDMLLDIAESARYIKFVLKVPGVCPYSHLREGIPASIYMDEIIVE